jgi:hypothetical protein
MADQASRVEINSGNDPGSSYRDNKDGTIHVTHHDGDSRTSYDVKYGANADDKNNALPGSVHSHRQ